MSLPREMVRAIADKWKAQGLVVGGKNFHCGGIVPAPLNTQRLRDIADAIDAGSVEVKVFSQTATEDDAVRIIRLHLTLAEKV